MNYNEQKLIIEYISTSATTVVQSYLFDSHDNSVVNEIKIEVDLPIERIGGNCYEALMQEMYRYDWYEINRETKEFTIVTPSDLLKTQQKNTYLAFPVPDFVFDIESNWYFEQEDLETVFSKYGHKKIDAVGYKALWHNPEMYFEYIVLDKGSWGENKFFILTSAKDSTNSRQSYKRLLEILKERKTKNERQILEDEYEYDDSGENKEYTDYVITDADEE